MSWNPLDPDLAVDPYPRYAALREQDPVYFEEAFGWWFVTGHEESMRVLREPGGEQRFMDFPADADGPRCQRRAVLPRAEPVRAGAE
jgi:cytochrome P450